MKIKIIEQHNRVYWDLFVFFIIAVAAFEIPYELLVAISNEKIKDFFDYLFLVTFGADILLNCITVQEVSGNGYLWIRKLFPTDYWSSSCEIDPTSTEQVVRQFPKTMVAYCTSWWFIIDFLAVFPFELVLGAYSGLNMARTLRLARLQRFVRITRSIRAIKAIKAFRAIDNVFYLNPSLGRFILLCVVVPWLIHLFACLISFYESAAGGMQYTYSQAMKLIFITFTTSDMAEVSTLGGETTAYIAVLVGYILFGLLMGNFATFLNQRDIRKDALEQKINQWKIFFKTYPQLFSKAIQKKVLLYEKDNIHCETHLQLNELVQAITDEPLREEITNAMETAS